MKKGDNADVYLVCFHTKTVKLSTDAPITIGREKYCDIVLNDLLVSRQHVEISWIDDTFQVKDLQSRNGTLLNGQAVKTSPIIDGDEIKVGGYTFMVRAASHMDVEKFLLREKVRMSSQVTIASSDLGIRFSEKGFSGNLAALSLDEVVQTLSQCLKTGVLAIADEEKKEDLGQLYFEDGEIVHAEIEGAAGTDAVIKVLNLTEGKFIFQNDVAAPERTVEQSTMSILLEACRQKDEAHREKTRG